MKILCITDQSENSNHSSIEGIFGSYLKERCEVYIVYFSKTLGQSIIKSNNKIYIPYSYKRKNICKELNNLINLKEVDIVIARNFFSVLKDLLKNKTTYNFRIGFWHSFPHTFRRFFEAQEEHKAVFRKTIEYKLKTHLEKKLARQCDFLIVMSEEFKKTFYQDIIIDYFPLPMGVDFDSLPSCRPNNNATRKLIYTGTVDHLRETDLVAEALSELKEDFVLDIYTQSDNEITRKIKSMGDKRINIYPALPRNELFRKITDYDIGIGLIPDNRLYRVSSPTKTLEYYSLGLPALVNYLPEYVSLFDNESAFFCDFTKESIKKTMREILAAPNNRLFEMGAKGKQVIKEQRDYKILSEKLYDFLERFRKEHTI
ncbi:MAG: group 1 glycosyl transferase [Nitrospirae bacterium]|nr:MAG: group 1 glycosyl transferase [Nitrospirota bacterium]